MTVRFAAYAFVVLLCLGTFGHAQSALAATPGALDTPPAEYSVDRLDKSPRVVIDLCDRFKKSPWSADGMSSARVLMDYADKSDKVTLKIGSVILQPIVDDHSQLNLRLLTLYVNGELRWALAHKGLADDSDAARAAGLTELVEGYQNMLTERPDLRSPFGDRLAALQSKGSFNEYLAEVRQKEKASKPGH